jgi:predicted ferric reductase
MRMHPAKKRGTGRGVPGLLLAAGFVALALTPLLAARLTGLEPASPLHELGTAFGLVAGALILLQFLTSGRYESLSGQVGLDRTMGFHRFVAYGLLLFAVLHPIGYVASTFMTDPNAAWSRLTGMLGSPRLRTGVLALVGLVMLVGLSVLRERIGWRHETWRASHGLLAGAVAGLTLHHAIFAGAYSSEAAVSFAWLTGAIVAAGALINVYAFRPWRMWRDGWRVETVSSLGAHIWELTLSCPKAARFDFRAGQFIWLTLAPNRPPFHDHPFSIASAPAELPFLRLIVREAGDCTNRFGEIQPGTKAAVDGPHGSFTLSDAGERVVMIAGGVGIAPLLGMLEQAASENDERSFALLYATRQPEEIAGIKRLDDLQSRVDLLFRFFVDTGALEPQFNQGPIGRSQIQEAVGSSPSIVVAYVCGPARMMEQVTDTLLDIGVPLDAIHYERFDFSAGKGRIDRMRRWQAIAILAAIGAGILLFGLG